MFLKTNILPDLAAPRNLILLLICQLVCEPSQIDRQIIPSPGEDDDLNESFMGMPLFTGPSVSGVLSVQSHRKDAFTSDDLRLLNLVGQSTATALENARLFDETNRQNAELAVINSVQ